MTKHTQTPWELAEFNQGYHIQQKDNHLKEGHVLTVKYSDEANARHIVHCVNTHDQLITLLRECYATINQLGYLSEDKLYKYNLERIDQALKQAEG